MKKKSFNNAKMRISANDLIKLKLMLSSLRVPPVDYFLAFEL